mmetsp:Transcript_5795/g.10405  ORF Transcript_5795/g.10405 Transcript_5795/m.10405 type:complete len:258 (+) Transcript_5795:147-920(+)
MAAGWRWGQLESCCGPQTVPGVSESDKEHQQCFGCCVSQDLVHLRRTPRPFTDGPEYESGEKVTIVRARETLVDDEVEEVKVSPRAYDLKSGEGSEGYGRAQVQDLRRQGLQQDAPSDFNGWWRCVQINGNMRDFLRDMGLNEDHLEEAAYGNYGIGEQVQHIVQTGHFFEVENFLTDPIRMQFRVGEGEQLTVDRGNRPIIVDPKWDGAVLYIKSRRVTGETIAHSRRFFDGDLMVLEFTSPKGVMVERIYKRKQM